MAESSPGPNSGGINGSRTNGPSGGYRIVILTADRAHDARLLKVTSSSRPSARRQTRLWTSGPTPLRWSPTQRR